VSRKSAEAERVLEENARRSREVDAELYAPWQPAELFMCEGRRRTAWRLLHRCGVLPCAGDPALEVGFGRLGWLADLMGLGLRCFDLHGIELDSSRAEVAKAAFPSADLRVGDAAEMPWSDEMFRLVVVSTVLTSILDPVVRQAVADEVARVLRPGGAILWYDFRVDNPSNPNVRGISKAELKTLFPGFGHHLRTVTLAPPLARRVVPVSWTLATLLECLPLLRTHILGVLVKPNDA
jgi:SAM-dependent methyltransferase